MKCSVRWLPALLTVALSACTAHSVVLDANDVDALRGGDILPSAECRFPRFDLVDARKHEHLGWIGGRELHYPEIMPWLERSIAAAATEDAEMPPVQVALTMAYTESHPHGQSFQLVLRARNARDESSNWRTYRGSTAGITWLGHDGEFAGFMEDAGAAAIRAMIAKEGRCRAASR